MVDTLPFWAIAAGLTLLGAIWGSFAAALCHRWPAGEGIVKGRSRCDNCNAQLRAYELVPILSYALQAGKCRHCAAPIGPASVLIEGLCAALGLLCGTLFAPLAALATAVFCWLLVPLALLDWRHYWLPDRLILVLAAAGLALGNLLPTEPELSPRITGAVAGYAVLQLLRWAYGHFRKVDAMGAGDPKLFAAIGLWVGWQPLAPVMLIASVLGLLHFLTRFRFADRDNTQLPLGSYMAASAMLWLFVGSPG